MAKPKVIVCATAYHPFVGGAEIAIAEVAKRLSSPYDFFILTARGTSDLPRRETRPEGIVIRLGLGTDFDKWLLPFLIPWYIISCFGFRASDLILWGMDISQGSLGAMLIKICFPRVPFVLTVQYGEREEYLRRGRLGLIARAFRAMLARADRVTAISGYLLGLARAFNYCGPAELIHNGVDVEKFKRENAKVKTTRQSAKVVITVSRLVPKNGVDVLIRAFVEVKKHMPYARLHIIGDGPERSALEKMVGKAGISEAVTFFGTVAYDALPSYLHAADLFVRPSRSEGMGNAFVEAMTAGLAVIGTAVGGIPDIIDNGKTGVMARSGDPRDLAENIMRLFTHAEERISIADAGREKAASAFDWGAIAPAYGKIFAQELRVKKRIVVATGLFPPEIGGPATYTALLAETLPQRGIGIRVVPFRSVRGLPKILRHAVYFLKILAASRGSDAVFAQDPVSTGLPALLAARVMGKPLLLKVVGDYAWEQFRQRKCRMSNVECRETTLEEFQTGWYGVIAEIRRFTERWVARQAKRIIVPSRYLRGIVMQWGVPEKNISVIHNAFEQPEGGISKHEARQALGIASGAFQIVSAGRLVPWKGFLELIDAMMTVRKEALGARLLIIGAGPQEQILRARIEARGLIDGVSLAGSMSREKLLKYFRAADLFVLNSSYEGFSHTLLEALAMEVPVMAADAGGNKEIITDGVSGRLYQDCDAEHLAREILHLYRHPEERHRFAAGGRDVLLRFGKEAMLEVTTGMIQTL